VHRTGGDNARMKKPGIPFIGVFMAALAIGCILLALHMANAGRMVAGLQIPSIILGIPFILLAPGFALQAALFPHHGELDVVARAAFSFGLSIAVNPFILLILDLLDLGVKYEYITISHILIIGMCAFVTFLRTRRETLKLSKDREKKNTLWTWWVSRDRLSQCLYGIIAFAFCMMMITGAIVAREPPAQPFTEFYLLDPQNQTMEYPRTAVVGKETVFLLAIVNHEEVTCEYYIVAVGGESQALVSIGPVILENGQIWQGEIGITMEQAGDGQKVEFLLERTDAPWPYRTLRVWLNVSLVAVPTRRATPSATAQ
jgi:uncharacterized membrane protein